MEHKYNLIREVNMEVSYFLGANTAAGFRSLYGGFCRGAGDYLHIVKGGPGTGKSGFMRAVGREAARRGYDVELVRCSGDPGSLDGLYIPALGLGWVDGTAPHVAEPGVFGADSDYVNLGEFCRTPLCPADAARASAGRSGLRVLGPAQAPVFRVRRKFRYRVLLKSPTSALLRGTILKARAACPERPGIAVRVDIDPQTSA